MMLKDFGTMFKGMDVVLLNLQYGDVQEEIDEFTKDTGIKVLQCKSVDNREDLDGLAALIELCDLVVSTRNVTIHLAGALGKETWVLMNYVTSFYWLLDRTDSIWYPTLQLYRQKTLDDWDGVLSIIHQDLQKKIGE
jgi:ADP-heptose:LPS heptosyltransferase